MSVISLPRPKNPAKPHRPATVRSPLGEQVDNLAELRSLLRQAVAAERTLTGEILQALTGAGLERFDGQCATAILDQRTTLTVDPELFLEAVGARGYAALTVGVTAARQLMGADDLAAISETTTSPVLRVEPLERRGAA